MYCPKCGSEENGQFCRKCGAGLQESKRIEEQGIQREKRRKKILIYIGLGLTILLIIFGLLFSAGKAIQRSFAKREAKRREAEIVKEEAEAKENMTDPLLTGVNWNKLSMWECPEQYIQ